MSDRTLNDPPWVVEIDGIKFATPEAVVILLQSVSEERDALEAQVVALRKALSPLASANRAGWYNADSSTDPYVVTHGSVMKAKKALDAE